jgi:integrase
MLSLTWDDIDFAKRQLKITPKDDWTPKDFEAREIELHPALEEYLANWKKLCDGHPKVVRWDRPKNQLSMAFTALRKKAGLANGSLHSLRHYADFRIMPSRIALL